MEGTLQTSDHLQHLVAVVGAGPAGLFAAKELAQAGKRVVLFNRDIKPGGLAEYGIFPTKYKMKEGLRKQFQQILENPMIDYLGNVRVGQDGDLSLNDLRAYGFQAILVTVGAQGTKWLGLPGEELLGVYHAKDIVYHYNNLPPFSEKKFAIGKRVALIGAGNVMIDIAHWLIRHKKVDEVIAVVRRGPAEVKFTKKELESVSANLDLKALDEEIQRTRAVMQAVGQDIEAARSFILSGLPKAEEKVSETRLRFDFLASPVHILGGERGLVRGLEVEDTYLVMGDDGSTAARRTGTRRVIGCDTVIFCIGDRVDENFGLPIRKNEFVKNPEPRFPVNGVSYEAYDSNINQPVERVFVAGWSREASHGLVGVARKDGESGAQAVLCYLEAMPALHDVEEAVRKVCNHLNELGKPVVTLPLLRKLVEFENCEAQRLGLDDFKCASNEEMLQKMELKSAK
jgi:ferredoxin--NADP+ reductase